MAGQPTFAHIHCSSRFDRSAESLEADLDDWMQHSSVITVTEVTTNYRAATLAEKGWNYFNARQGNGADDCAIAWKTDVWRRKSAWVRQLTSIPYTRPIANKPGPPFWACNALLKHVGTGKTMLVSVTHLPHHAMVPEWHEPLDAEWRDRKANYQQAMRHWSDLVRDLERKTRPDGALIVADWNLNLKDQWVREYLHDHWKKCGLKRAWVHFPTYGGSLAGNSIIDGSYYGGMQVTDGPVLMPRVRSSDHRPYRETFKLVGGLVPGRNGDDHADGDTKPGKAWWGFGDYQMDEIYGLARIQGDAGGEVL